MTKTILLNGREFQTQSRTIQDLLRESHAPEKGIAVARNEAVVRRSQWAEVEVEDNDRIEIIRAVQGG